MRVLQVIDSLALGGAEVLLTELYRGFKKRGIECEHYLLKSEGTALEHELLKEGARIHAPINASVYSPTHISGLHALMRRSCYDLVHVHLFPAQLWTAVAARMVSSGVPLVTTEHSTVNRRRASYMRALDRWMYAQYHRIACISAAAKDNLVAWVPQTRYKVLECPNGIAVEKFQSASPYHSIPGVPKGAPLIISVGRFEEPKDFDTLIRSMAPITDAHLLLVGAGRLGDKLRALTAALGVTDRVHFLGVRRDIPELLKSADIYVQSSRWEGFGLAAVEAMAAGLPIISTMVPGLGEVVGGAGMLFCPGDYETLSNHLAKLIRDPSLRRELSHASQKRSEIFSLSKTLDCYEALYHEVAVGGTAPQN